MSNELHFFKETGGSADGSAPEALSRALNPQMQGFARVNQVTSASLRYPLSVFKKNSTLNRVAYIIRQDLTVGSTLMVTSDS